MLLKAYEELEENFTELGAEPLQKTSKSDQIKMAIKKQTGPFTLNEIEAACPLISHDMIRVVMRKMKDDNELTNFGKGRGAKWINKR